MRQCWLVVTLQHRSLFISQRSHRLALILNCSVSKPLKPPTAAATAMVTIATTGRGQHPSRQLVTALPRSQPQRLCQHMLLLLHRWWVQWQRLAAFGSLIAHTHQTPPTALQLRTSKADASVDVHEHQGTECVGVFGQALHQFYRRRHSQFLAVRQAKAGLQLALAYGGVAREFYPAVLPRLHDASATATPSPAARPRKRQQVFTGSATTAMAGGGTNLVHNLAGAPPAAGQRWVSFRLLWLAKRPLEPLTPYFTPHTCPSLSAAAVGAGGASSDATHKQQVGSWLAHECCSSWVLTPTTLQHTRRRAGRRPRRSAQGVPATYAVNGVRTAPHKVSEERPVAVVKALASAHAERQQAVRLVLCCVAPNSQCLIVTLLVHVRLPPGKGPRHILRPRGLSIAAS